MSLDGARTLGSYQLLSQLAVGGMAEIYVARTHGVGGFEKLVALKVIHPNFSADPDFVQMLVDEAKLSVQLSHANIVQTFDLGRVDEQYYIAMELIDGVDLYKLLRRASEHEIDFPFEVAAFIAAEVAQGLDYAHRKRDARGRPLKIVHRDVSPQNVLVSLDGEVKIVDFGIAKAAMRGQQTAAGVIKGKYYYMSPEQAWGDPIDARTDIFSAGILLYEMLVGQMLYMEEDLEKLLDVVRKASIPPPSSHRKSVPDALEAVVMRCLQKRADDRFATAGELGTALQQFLHAHAPDFSRARLATFVREVMGDDPNAWRDPRSPTTHGSGATEPNPAGMVSAIEVRDENSLIFSLSDLKPDVDDVRPPTPPPPPSPRRADVATSVRGGGGFEENEATIVDGGDTLSLAGDDDDQPTGARELPMPRAHATRRVEAPPDDEDDQPTPQEILDAPPGLAAPAAISGAVTSPAASPAGLARQARQPRPTPLGVRRHPNAPRPVNPQAPTVPMPPPQPNAPRVAVDDADTRARTRRAAGRPTPPPQTLPAAHGGGFGDDAPEPTVAARPHAAHEQPRPHAAHEPARPHEQPRPPSQKVQAIAPPLRQSFEEPTRIPPAHPPPIDSGRFVPGLDDGSDGIGLPFSSPLGDPEPTLRPRAKGGIYVALALLAVVVIGAVAAVSLAGGGDSRGRLSIISLPPGAEVRIDGVAGMQQTPLTVRDVDPRASHHLRVSKSGFDVWEQDVKFPPGEHELSVQAVLVPTVGTIEIASIPSGAEAIVNGRVRGMTPTTVGDLPPNDDLVLELRLRGYKVAHETVSWSGKRLIKVSIPLEKAK